MLESTRGTSPPRRKEVRSKNEPSTQQRIFLIQDAISGLGYQMSAPETVIFPFVDYPSVLLQAGRIISIWNKRTKEMIFSSLGDEALIDKYGQPFPQKDQMSLWDSDYAIQVDHLNRQKYEAGKGKDPYTSDLLDEYQIIGEVLGHFDQFGSAGVTRQSDSAFSRKIIDALSTYQRPLHTPPGAIDLKLKEISDLLRPMGRLLDEVFFDLRKSHVFQVVEDDFEIVKLFAVVRTVPSSKSRYRGFFNYTASLLLSDDQYHAILRLLEKVHGSSEAGRLMKYLESPLGLEDRSVADTVFSSGNVGFGGKVGSEELDVADDETARRRQEVEELVYKKIHQIDKEGSLHVFYVPVHVGGVPWLAFFTFTDKVPRRDHESWKRNYRIYRDVIPKITSQIRTGTKEIYLRLLAEKLTTHLHRWKVGSYPLDELTRRVSEDWQKINQVYPYDRVRLKVAEPGEERPGDMTLRLDEGRSVIIEVMEGSTFLRRDVNYDLLDKGRIRKACDAALQDYIFLNDALQKRTVAYSTHNMRNSLLNLRSIIQSTDLTADAARSAINSQIDELITLEQFSNYLLTGREDRKPVFVQNLDGTFPELKDAIDKALTVFDLDSFMGNSATRLRQIKEAGTLTLNFSRMEALNGHGAVPIRFCTAQMNVVVNGLITNALKYNKLSAPALRIWVSADDERVYLHVRNPANKNPAALRGLAKGLTNPADLLLDYVGINLVHLACHACMYLPPVWKEEAGELVATVQVATRDIP